jgi:hypothetical protein
LLRNTVSTASSGLAAPVSWVNAAADAVPVFSK